jgi:eukaryotic-like serine/threonine-protein kinase
MYDRPDSLVGKQIDQFRLDQFIARGAMGMVFKAFDTILLRTVAVKLISKLDVEGASEEELATMEEARKRLIQEAKAAGRLTHPNIVTIHCYGETPEFVYICMELVNGKTLSQQLNEQRILSLGETLTIFEQILQALELSTQEEIVHRDIKPSNIMIMDGNRVKVMDFGIAKLPSLSMTTVGTVLGTPHYMSPEQISGQMVDIRSDLFSVGAVLYEVLTGERPFKAESTAALIYKILQVDPIPLRVLNAQLPEPVGDIVKKALAKDPAQRFQTPTEMLIALRSVSESRTVTGMANDITVAKKNLLSEQTIQVKPEELAQARAQASTNLPATPPPEPAAIPPLAPQQAPTGAAASETPAEKLEVKEEQAEPKKVQAKEKAARIQPSPKPAPRDQKATGAPGSLAKIIAGVAILLVLVVVSGILLQRMFLTPTPQIPSPAASTTEEPAGTGQSSAPGDQIKKSVESLIAQARGQWDSDLATAQNLLEQAVALDPTNFEAIFQLARLLTFKKDFPAATQHYQNALQINNQVPEVFFNLGFIYLSQGAFDQAIENYETCRALSPPYLDEVLTNLAICHWKKNNPTQAKLLLKQALDLNPNNDRARNHLNTLEKTAGAKKP